MLTIMGYMPAPPAGAGRPTDWGVPEVARDLLDPLAAEVSVQTRSVPMTAASVEAELERHERCNGPLVAARALLGDRYPELREDLLALLADVDEARDGTFAVEAEYLLVAARKAA
jgi:hypothetical protein